MAKSKFELDEEKTKHSTLNPAKKEKETKLPTGSGTEKSKKEFTPRVRNAGHFLFEDTGGSFEEVASYPDLKSLVEGVKEKAKGLLDSEEAPNWVHFQGRFKKIEIERIVKVKL